MRLLQLVLLCCSFFLFSCNQNSSKIDSKTYSEFQKKGTEISNLTQGTLLNNVGKAIQKGGPEYAVEFCNLKASSIVDSLNLNHDCIISRVSAKNRNAENNLKSKQEKELWKHFQNKTLGDTIVLSGDKLVFYKPVKIALPACLKCHGEPGADINIATQTKLQTLYPKDLATGYKINDFRGLWKIEFDLD